MEKNIDQMSTFELSRWCALTYAINLIAEECEDRKIDFNTLNLEPLYVRKYVDKVSDIIADVIVKQDKQKNNNRNMLIEHNLINNIIEITKKDYVS